MNRPSLPESTGKPKAAGDYLTGAQCMAMVRDHTHLFRRMWAADAWAKMDNSRPACWGVNRVVPPSGQREPQDSTIFFAETPAGTHCPGNWFEGNPGQLGLEGQTPRFAGKEAAALLGFDETIDEFCASALGGWDHARDFGHAERCARASINILSLYGHRVPFNICRNLEWQVCAAQGKLPGQGSSEIKFSRAPSTLQPGGGSGKPVGRCCGWTPENMHPRGGVFGYATDDIFYLEAVSCANPHTASASRSVKDLGLSCRSLTRSYPLAQCLFTFICSNGDDIFAVDVGESFKCDFSEDGFRELQELLLSPWSEPAGTEQCATSHTCIEADPSAPGGADGVPACSQCWRINQGTGGGRLLCVAGLQPGPVRLLHERVNTSENRIVMRKLRHCAMVLVTKDYCQQTTGEGAVQGQRTTQLNVRGPAEGVRAVSCI